MTVDWFPVGHGLLCPLLKALASTKLCGLCEIGNKGDFSRKQGYTLGFCEVYLLTLFLIRSLFLFNVISVYHLTSSQDWNERYSEIVGRYKEIQTR